MIRRALNDAPQRRLVQRLGDVDLVVVGTLRVDRQIELDLVTAAELRAHFAHRVDRRGRLHALLVDAHDLVALARHADRVDGLFGRALDLVEKPHLAPFQ